MPTNSKTHSLHQHCLAHLSRLAHQRFPRPCSPSPPRLQPPLTTTTACHTPLTSPLHSRPALDAHHSNPASPSLPCLPRHVNFRPPSPHHLRPAPQPNPAFRTPTPSSDDPSTRATDDVGYSSKKSARSPKIGDGWPAVAKMKSCGASISPSGGDGN